MRFHIDLIMEEVIEEYNLRDKVDKDGWLYCKIGKAIYGLKESGKLANVQLQKVLAKRGYYPYVHSHRAYTSMNPNQSPSPLSLTIFESNMFKKKMLII